MTAYLVTLAGGPAHTLFEGVNRMVVEAASVAEARDMASSQYDGDENANWGAATVTAIAADADSEDFQIHDNYYDHSDAGHDINCVFPLDRLRELAEAGEIGAVADRIWSGFMGRIYNRSKVMEESGPAFADALLADGVNVLIAAPS